MSNKEKIFIYLNSQQAIEILCKDHYFRNCIIWATNLHQDIYATFGLDYVNKNMSPLFNKGGFMIFATVYVKENVFDKLFSKKEYILSSKDDKKLFHKITFGDTLNHFKASVEKLGEIMKIPKVAHPKCFLRTWQSYEEINEMLIYNINDSRISFAFIEWYQDELNSIGGNLKVTISSVAIDLYKRKFLKFEFITESEDRIKLVLKSFKGGRCSIHKRGEFISSKGYNNLACYDVNSMYPSIMANELLPDPNFSYDSKNVTIEEIQKYEGCCYAELFLDSSKEFPLLGVRQKTGTYYPYGTIKDHYCFCELRKALEEGYIINKLGEGVVYTKSVNVFGEFVNTLYNLRLDYKKNDDPRELIIKLILNSSFGKFGYNPFNKDTLTHVSSMLPSDESLITKYHDENSDYLYINNIKLQNYCIPIWACYITAIARIKIYNYVKSINFDFIYMDTDSIFTNQILENSLELGKLKKEYDIQRAIFVRSKLYCVIKKDLKEIKKHKGLPRQSFSYNDFRNMCMNKKSVGGIYTQFTKVSTAIRNRGKEINQTFETPKELSLNDTRRDWRGQQFDLSIQESNPIFFINENYSRLSDQKTEKYYEMLIKYGGNIPKSVLKRIEKMKEKI